MLRYEHTTKKGTVIQVELSYDQDGGHFEAWDKFTSGNVYYICGELEMQDNILYGYDGVFSLPQHIIDTLAKNGVTIDL